MISGKKHILCDERVSKSSPAAKSPMALSKLSEGNFDVNTVPYQTPSWNSTNKGLVITPNFSPSAFPTALVAYVLAVIKLLMGGV